jgi:hypothetical protein
LIAHSQDIGVQDVCGGRVVRYDLAGHQPVEQHPHWYILISWGRPEKLATEDRPIIDKWSAFCA